MLIGVAVASLPITIMVITAVVQQTHFAAAAPFCAVQANPTANPWRHCCPDRCGSRQPTSRRCRWQCCRGCGSSRADLPCSVCSVVCVSCAGDDNQGAHIQDSSDAAGWQAAGRADCERLLLHSPGKGVALVVGWVGGWAEGRRGGWTMQAICSTNSSTVCVMALPKLFMSRRCLPPQLGCPHSRHTKRQLQVRDPWRSAVAVATGCCLDVAVILGAFSLLLQLLTHILLLLLLL